MRVAFWSNVHGQAGVTSNLIALSLMLALKTDKKTLIFQSQFSLNYLENILIGFNSKEMEKYFTDIGIDAIIRNAKIGKLDEDVIKNSVISIINKKLDLLLSTTKLDKSLFQKDLLDNIDEILNNIAKYYEFIIYDINDKNSKLTNSIIKNSDLLVINLPQNRFVIEECLEKYKFDDKKVIYLLGKYDDNSYYNKKNLIRKYKQFNNKNLKIVPYNIEFLDSFSNGNIINFFMKNVNSTRQDENNYFIREIDYLLKFILETSEELK